LKLSSFPNVDHSLKDLISILLVDDDEDDYLITRDLIDEISYQRYQLDWIDDYGQALRIMDRQDYDVYLVDYRLGARTGLDLISEGQAREYHRPIILLTGQGDLETDARAMQLGAADYLVKSQLTADKLERSVRYAIQQARTLHEIQVLNTELEERVERRTQALRQAVADLRQSQQLFRSIAQSFPNGSIMVLDRDLSFVFVEGSELQRLGFQPAQLVGQPMMTFFPENLHPIMEYYLQRVREGESLNFEINFREYIYSMRGVPLEGAEGRIDQILLVSNNITREKKAEEEVRNALKKERQLNELKSRFVSMASHEFRTPLSTILSSVSLISRYTESEQQHKREKHIERVKSSVRNLTGILEEFLSLTRLEEGKIEVRADSFDAEAFFLEVIDEMQGLLKPGQRIHLRVEGPSEVYLDKHLMRNILNNLLSNAIKYSQEGDSIEVTLGGDEAMLKFSIIDYGIGIPEEEQVHLFERFYRAQNATNIQGTGLGLNIVRKYVSLLNGQVSFESSLSVGTTFTITCPRRFEPDFVEKPVKT
jgi:PAS domain S-box-containing protein